MTMLSNIELLPATWTWAVLVSLADGLNETPCPQTWVLYEAQPVCIKVFTHPMNWMRAREVCQQEKGGDLAEVEDAEKMAFIERMVQRQCLVETEDAEKMAFVEKIWLPPRKNYWIGVSDLDADGVFEFVDGIKVKRNASIQIITLRKYQTMTLETNPLAQRHELDSRHISALIEMTCNATLTGVCQSVASFQWKVGCYDVGFAKVVKVVEMDDYYPAATTRCQATKHSHDPPCNVHEVREFRLKEDWTRCNLKVTCCLCLSDADHAKRLEYLDTGKGQAECTRPVMCLERFLRGAEAVLDGDDVIDNTLWAKRALISGLVYLGVGLLLVTFYKHSAIMALVRGKGDADDDDDDDDVADDSDTETAKRTLRFYRDDSSDTTISV